MESIFSQAVVCVTSWVVGLVCEYFTCQFYEMPKLCAFYLFWDSCPLQKVIFESGAISLPTETGKIIIYVEWHASCGDVPKQLQPLTRCRSINMIEKGRRKYLSIPIAPESLVLGSEASLAWHKVPGLFMVTVIPTHVPSCFLIGALLVMGAHSHNAEDDLAEN